MTYDAPEDFPSSNEVLSSEIFSRVKAKTEVQKIYPNINVITSVDDIPAAVKAAIERHLHYRKSGISRSIGTPLYDTEIVVLDLNHYTPLFEAALTACIETIPTADRAELNLQAIREEIIRTIKHELLHKQQADQIPGFQAYLGLRIESNSPGKLEIAPFNKFSNYNGLSERYRLQGITKATLAPVILGDSYLAEGDCKEIHDLILKANPVDKAWILNYIESHIAQLVQYIPQLIPEDIPG